MYGTLHDWNISAQRNDSGQHRSLASLDGMPCISCCAWSANGKLSVYGSENNVVQNWDTSTAEAVVPSIKGGITRVAVIKDGTLIMSCRVLHTMGCTEVVPNVCSDVEALVKPL